MILWLDAGGQFFLYEICYVNYVNVFVVWLVVKFQLMQMQIMQCPLCLFKDVWHTLFKPVLQPF